MFTPIKRFITATLLISLPLVLTAAGLDYQLTPQKVAPHTYAFMGKLEDFSTENGGNIVNTGFIVTEAGVIVFDTGPSRRYGEAMLKSIRSISKKPILHIFNSHHHPDHFLGNQAFKEGTLWSLPDTGKLMAQVGDSFAENMYRLTGDWMRGTEVKLPDRPLETRTMTVGGHTLKFFELHGHSGADLAMLDKKTGVLFASDIVFYQRALTTPHTPDLNLWIDDLKTLRGIKYKTLIPGHGPIVRDHAAIDQTIAYLEWLDHLLSDSAEKGKTMTEVMSTPIPPAFSNVALAKAELKRTVVHLYPKYEETAF